MDLGDNGVCQYRTGSSFVTNVPVWCRILMVVAGLGGHAVHVEGQGVIWKLSPHSAQFCSESKTALKIVYFKNQEGDRAV